MPERSCGESGSGNLIVQGDNLHALKALLPRYAGQVKCIYIDPPCSTGNEGWVYNDNVNSPEIRKWLGEVVGKEGETLDQHDRWLCMMYPRLVLLIIVATRQALQMQGEDSRKMYQSSGGLMHHFDHLSPTQRDGLLREGDGAERTVPCSRANVLGIKDYRQTAFKPPG